jgi:hypothetical protein
MSRCAGTFHLFAGERIWEFPPGLKVDGDVNLERVVIQVAFRHLIKYDPCNTWIYLAVVHSIPQCNHHLSSLPTQPTRLKIIIPKNSTPHPQSLLTPFTCSFPFPFPLPPATTSPFSPHQPPVSSWANPSPCQSRPPETPPPTTTKAENPAP